MNKELKLERVFHRRENVDLHYVFQGSLENTKTNLLDICDKLAKEAKKNDYEVVFQAEYEGYDGGYEVYANVYRWETMKEYNKRIEQEAEKKERARKSAETKKAKALAKAMLSEADERALYKKLHEKFGEK